MLLRLIPSSRAAFKPANDTLVVFPLASVSRINCDAFTVLTVVTSLSVFVFFVAISFLNF